MAITLLVHKTLGGNLAPVDAAGREALAHIGQDELLAITFRRPRNIGHHRKFFALLSLIYENQTRYQSIEELLDVVKVLTGHCNVVTMRDGKEVFVPKSIAFASMDQSAFEAFWEKVVKVVCEKILPGITKADLEREMLEFIS